MTFTRRSSDTWHHEVPGTRWFKADLHTHTIDDWPGKRAKMPSGLPVPASSDELRHYARLFLAGAARNGIQVLGLTPHSARLRAESEESAVWTIVEEWNQGQDKDGVPFRDKIYAVFPGFEPSLNEGKDGLHLIFLFDPEIGRQDYLKAFDIAMGAVSPWRGSELRMSQKRADEVFRGLHDFHRQKSKPSGAMWQYVILAPHVDGRKGLLDAKKSQVLQYFQSDQIAALELSDDKLPHEALRNRDWLADGMREYRQAFFHGTDAYRIPDLGKRHTWLKLARPRIEALRQAFIARDSRIRIGFERGDDGALTEIAEPPDVMLSGRGWLKSVTVQGGASFFGRTIEGTPRNTRFNLSPDLTCIIGGSMTGKSTFLDGLRLRVAAPLPTNSRIRKQVEDRARERFAGGSARIVLEIPGSDPAQEFPGRWPAEFFAQNELQRLAEDPGSVEDILARLVRSETAGIGERTNRLRRLDKELQRLATRELKALDDRIAEVEQECQRCRQARDELNEFKAAGVERLNQVSSDLERWRAWIADYNAIKVPLADAVDTASELELPQIHAEVYEKMMPHLIEVMQGVSNEWDQLRKDLEATGTAFMRWSATVMDAVTALEKTRDELHEHLERHLAAQGISAAKIRELDALNRRASLLPANETHLEQLKNQLSGLQQRFKTCVRDREDVLGQQRDAYDRVAEVIERDFGGRIVVRRVANGRKAPLDRFLRDLGERGVTRWWNGLTARQRPYPRLLLKHLRKGNLGKLGMSPAVAATFRETMTRARRRRLAAIRCPDRYVLAMNLGGSHRPLRQLSGGQRVSVLLSLLLETRDDRPLVIDQPEDELDNRFLFDTVLPALKRLKGRRQIIIATHNANIVVNGDADQVIQLDATGTRGKIVQSGAIEDPAVRDAIVATVDGGDEAFRLRHRKYGY